MSAPSVTTVRSRPSHLAVVQSNPDSHDAQESLDIYRAQEIRRALPVTDGTLLAALPIAGTSEVLAVVGYILPGRAQPEGVPPGTAEPAAALAVDHERRCARAGGKDIELTFQEFELLAFLAANPARVFTRAELLAYAWQRNDLLNTRTVDIHICRLRQKLGPAYASCLATEHRVGYRFRPPASSS